MDITIGSKSFKLTKTGIMALGLAITMILAALSWFQDTKESNKTVPILEATIGELKIEVADKSEDIEDNTAAIEELSEEFGEFGEQLDDFETNQIIMMREMGVEPVE